MARGNALRASESGSILSPKELARVESIITYQRATRVKEKMMKEQGLTEDQFKELAEKRVGLASAVQRQFELAAAEMDGSVDKMKNDKDDPNSPWGMRAQEKAIRGLDVERGVLYDRYNRLISTNDGTGMDARVAGLVSQLVMGHVTHNHPEGLASLSVGDIAALINGRLASIAAVGRENGDRGEIKWRGKSDPPDPEKNEDLKEFVSGLEERWTNCISGVARDIIKEMKMSEVMKLADGSGNLNISNPETPAQKKFVKEILFPKAERYWRIQMEEEMDRLGYDYAYDAGRARG